MRPGFLIFEWCVERDDVPQLIWNANRKRQMGGESHYERSINKGREIHL